MLKTVYRHRIVRGYVEILADVAIYLAVMLVVIVLLGQLAKLGL